ncbi:hypothetical protein GE061_008018 [Apolygus lucorum]|uniref:RRM domain-containing protein n=1 Tax=Apolygus lucorum TaxID=248454 RepID=A0A6A4ISP4_APOLU|nr:hypothetical protein GE061_008018 [Apolygus lucorum]
MSEVSTDPPNSRLFILCGKQVTVEELHEAFDKYGSIRDIWIVKDKNTMESKGVVYIKFSKSSEAALAHEEMNGKVLGSGGKPIKVMIAHSREQGSRYDDDQERLQRLFIIVPKTSTEDNLRDYFKKFGDLDYVSIVKNRTNGESKGVAYVKYLRAYHAAKAYEECSKNYKAVFARPREQKNQSSFENNDRMSFGGGGGGAQFNGSSSRTSGGSGWLSSAGVQGGNNQSGDARLMALLHASLRDEQIYRLFDISPGLVDIRPQANRFYGMQKVLVEYNCCAAATHACEKLNGFEYPPGQRISVKPYGAGSDDAGNGGPGSGVMKSEVNGSAGMTTISNSELATLTAALAKAENIIKTAGLGSQSSQPQSGLLKPSEAESFGPTYCSVALPPPQPLAAPTDDETYRLFIVCQPGLPSMYALRDIFGRFGNLIEVYTLHGKNCGYVTYATKESSDAAIKTLHLQEVCGMRMKVMVAEPPRPGARSDRKRMRTDEEDQASSS